MLCKHLTAACNWVTQTDPPGKIWHEVKTCRYLKAEARQHRPSGSKKSEPPRQLSPQYSAQRRTRASEGEGRSQLQGQNLPYSHVEEGYKDLPSAEAVPEILYSCLDSSQPSILSPIIFPCDWSTLHLEYCALFWAPHDKKDNKALECIQKRAMELCRVWSTSLMGSG